MRVLLFTLCLLYAGQSVSAAMLGHAVLESRLVFLSTADFSDEAYWATHHICVARVRSLDIDPERVIVELETDHCFTAGAPSHVVARGDGFCFRVLDSGAPVETGDRLLVSFPKDRDVGWLDAEVLPDAPTGSALHKRLDRISALRVRANADRDMIDGAMDDDAAVSAYCLRRMVKRPPGLTADDQRRLNRLRESATSEAERKELLDPRTPWHRIDDLMLRNESRLLSDELAARRWNV